MFQRYSSSLHDQLIFTTHTGGSCLRCETKDTQVDVLFNLNTITPDKTLACENMPADKTSVQGFSGINPQLNAN